MPVKVFLSPAHLRHLPQRPEAGSVGLVVENARRPEDQDGFGWFCFDCGALVHCVEVAVADIVRDLPPLFAAFYADPRRGAAGNAAACILAGNRLPAGPSFGA
jgi:3-hydroxyanthranilate 3,4-dioxygenase